MSLSKRALYFRWFGADGELRRHLPDLGSTLDIGCSDGRGSELLTGAAGCDIYEPALRVAAAAGRRRLPVVADLRRLPYRDGAFDAVVSQDVIEHFDKPDALLVLREMERVARRFVGVLTPSGFVPQAPGEDEPWQEHRCGFDAAELEALGFDVVGVGGAKVLRRDYGAFRGGSAGRVAALATRPLLRSRPDRTFHIFGFRRLLA